MIVQQKKNQIFFKIGKKYHVLKVDTLVESIILSSKERPSGIIGIGGGTILDIAKAVVFLASDDADYITGETIHINGGMLMA